MKNTEPKGRRFWLILGVAVIAFVVSIIASATIASSGRIVYWSRVENVCLRCGLVAEQGAIEIIGNRLRDGSVELRPTAVSRVLFSKGEDWSSHHFGVTEHFSMRLDLTSGLSWVRDHPDDSLPRRLAESQTLAAALEELNRKDSNLSRRVWYWLARITGDRRYAPLLTAQVTNIIGSVERNDKGQLLRLLKEVDLQAEGEKMIDSR